MCTEQQYLGTLRQRFGFDDFRSGQLESIQSLINDKSVLCIHPTGFGKSLLYQLPSTMLDGLTVVISPLLALMRDQLKHLNQRFNIPAAAINSDQDEIENEEARRLASSGQLKVLFVAPEQLDHVDRFEFLLNLPVSLVVVDEAHCISTWGHDFRPSYRQIVNYVQAIQLKNSEVRVLGLTATANGKTEDDIKEQLSTIRPIKVLRASMDRPNISLSSITCESIAEKLEACHQLVKQLLGCGLIYCATRENTAIVAEYLQQKGIKATGYHAGLSPDAKRELQSQFIADEYQVMAATNALGMGIDKPNLRYVIHFDIPGSITAYYQEVGRAGRDGKQARGILLYHGQDVKIQKHFIHSAQPSHKDFEEALEVISNVETPQKLTQIKMATGKHPTIITVILAELVEQGYVQKKSQRGSQIYLRTDKSGSPNLQRYKNQLETRTRELEAMIQYAKEERDCRMGVLRKALGDHEIQPCGHCCICKKSPLVVDTKSPAALQASKWLEERLVRIPESRMHKISQGLALLDGQHRSTAFVTFMKRRANTSMIDIGLSEDLKDQLLRHAEELSKHSIIQAIIPLPSRTWGARDAIANLLGTQLNVPVMHQILQWRQLPPSRQGELFNNDQRKHNVQKFMTCTSPSSLHMDGVLLLDDYIGSGVTLKEAARALRKEGHFQGVITPLTIAQVKWKLGASGMI
ncbi:MAG: RecQ family ATP-dependent DNA helicase [Chlamydiota bacterium]